MDKQKWIRKIVMIVIIVGLFIWLNQAFLEIPPREIRDLVMAFGWIAPGIYLIMFTVRPLVLFPASLLAIVGGLAFGFWFGVLLTIIGACLGAILSFLAIRKLGITFGKIPDSAKYETLRQQIDKKGFIILLILRLLPFLHFELVTYLSAVSTIRFSHYFFATLLGLVPGALIYCGIGSSTYSGGNELIIMSIASLVVLTALPILFRKKLSRMLAVRLDQE
ncbi:TVP38/TMEM64 family protein [Pseudalkalibacillus sp. R45]|uniref:TVP38/TMEM64 family protein n=1 Tax=Pseudalkalibacillus sp. R45 TaxID=3457433 RepID=UPI003FCC851B